MRRVRSGQLQPRIAASEVAIGKAQARDRPAKARLARFVDVEAGLKQHAANGCTDRLGLHLDGAGGKADVTQWPAAADPDRAQDRSVGENPTNSGRALEARIGEQLTGNEVPRFLWLEFSSRGRKNGCEPR